MKKGIFVTNSNQFTQQKCLFEGKSRIERFRDEFSGIVAVAKKQLRMLEVHTEIFEDEFERFKARQRKKSNLKFVLHGEVLPQVYVRNNLEFIKKKNHFNLPTRFFDESNLNNFEKVKSLIAKNEEIFRKLHVPPFE
ncbi:MAG: hypothetical protein WCI36_04965 [bacterium]